MEPYDHKKIEEKWQAFWEKNNLYTAIDPTTSTEVSASKKFYALIEFPYPSGDGLHVGHIKSNTAMDIISRKRRMEGYNVLYPIGWDAFGLPTENYAIKTGKDPRVVTQENTDTFRRQLKSIGFSFDWSREVNTTNPAYYKWTQWIFLQFLKHNLAYKKKMQINWCPKDLIGLANEEVIDGKCERCGTLVEKRDKEQWMLAITKYADKLEGALDAMKPGTPLIEVTTGEFAARPDKPTVPRSVILAIIKHWEKDEYLCLTSEKHGWTTFVIGGIEKGEEAVDCARREIIEETGYTDLKYVRTLGSSVFARHFAPHKDVNRLAEVHGLYFELTGPAHTEVAVEEANHQKVIWVPRAQMEAALQPKITDWVFWQRFEGKEDKDISFTIPPQPLLDWPTAIKDSQRNWIGKSEGVNFKCTIKDLNINVEMYNSVPQSYHAETFTVIAPEHHLVAQLIAGTEKEKEIADFVKKIIQKKSEKGFDIDSDMEGIFTGRYIANFADTGRDLPIWIASYVIADYGTGIVNASAHDTRDFMFAKKYNIPLHPVVFPVDPIEATKVRNLEYCYAREEDGVMAEPPQFKGRAWQEVRKDVIDHIVEKRYGVRKVNYKLRDWVFSRQRYWGEPIPVVHCEKCGIVPLPESELPLELPKVENYKPTENGESPLAAITDWVNTKCPTCGGPAKRETDTMPNWAGSSWYYLRYTDPKNAHAFASPEKLKYWTPVDWYNGGMEHTTLHLLYSRFWHKFLFDIGLVPTNEPYQKRTSHGLILAKGGEKMSKSKGNVINPDTIVNAVGADSLRLYEMFMGPFDQAIAWDENGIVGCRRFIERVWKLKEKINPQAAQNPSLEIIVNKAIKKVSEDIEAMRFNTAVSTLMIAANDLEKEVAASGSIRAEYYQTLLVLLAPFAPHVTEEIWQEMFKGTAGVPASKIASIHCLPWPVFDPTKIKEAIVTIPIQINGKTRATVSMSPDSTEEEVKNMALSMDEIKKWVVAPTAGDLKSDQKLSIKKVIYVKGRLLNIVIDLTSRQQNDTTRT